MIDMLQGELAARGPDHVVVLCSGVGYRAAASAQTLQRMPPRGETVTLHTQLISRDDALDRCTASRASPNGSCSRCC